MDRLQDAYCGHLLQLWQAFHTGHYSRDHTLYKGPYAGIHSLPNGAYLHRTSGFSRLPWGSLNHGLLPRVYAQETVEQDKSPNQRDETIMEKVMQSKPKALVSDKDVEEYLANETGMDRLKDMYHRGENGKLSAELNLCVGVTKFTTLLTFAFTSPYGGLQAREEFRRANEHTKFQTRFRAVRAHQDAIIIGGMKFGTVWALRTCFFTSIFLLTSQSIAVYRNKSSPLEYAAAGALTGALLKANLGLKGMFAGGVITGFFGVIAGSLIWLNMYLSNETQEQRHYWHVHEILRDKRELKILLGKEEPAS